MHGHQRFIFGGKSPKGDSAQSVWRKFHFPFKLIRKEQCFLQKQFLSSVIGQHPKKDFLINGNRTGGTVEIFCIPAFIWRLIGAELLNLANPTQNPYFLFSDFFQNFKESVIEYSFNKRSVSHFGEISAKNKSPEVSLVAAGVTQPS